MFDEKCDARKNKLKKWLIFKEVIDAFKVLKLTKELTYRELAWILINSIKDNWKIFLNCKRSYFLDYVFYEYYYTVYEKLVLSLFIFLEKTYDLVKTVLYFNDKNKDQGKIKIKLNK